MCVYIMSFLYYKHPSDCHSSFGSSIKIHRPLHSSAQANYLLRVLLVNLKVLHYLMTILSYSPVFECSMLVSVTAWTPFFDMFLHTCTLLCDIQTPAGTFGFCSAV